MMTGKLSKFAAALALLLSSGGTAHAAPWLWTSAVWAGSDQSVHCTITNPSNSTRNVTITLVREDGSIVRQEEHSIAPMRMGTIRLAGQNQFVTCAFDLHLIGKGQFRANIFVTDPDSDPVIFYDVAR